MERDFDKKLVPIGQAAEFLGVSVDTVRRWDEKGILHSERPDGKDRYFSVTELEKVKFAEPLSISEAAQKLNISETTLRRLEEKGLIKPERNTAGDRVYTLDCLEDFIRSDYYLRQGVIEDKILNDSSESPAIKEDYKEDIQNLREQHKVLNAQIEDHKQHLGKLNTFRKMFYYGGVALVTGLLMLVFAFTVLFILYPSKTAKWFGLSSLSAQAADGKATPASSYTASSNSNGFLSSLLQPVGALSLQVVKVVSPETYTSVLANQPINDVNDIFSVSSNGNIQSNFNLALPNSSYLVIPDTAMIKNLNAEYVQGKVPGLNSGDLVFWDPNSSIAGLAVNSENIVNSSITSDKIADNSITTSKIVDGAITQIKLGTITEINKVAGSAVQLSTGGGLTNNAGLSLKTDCNVGEILNWTGSAWECVTQSKSGVAKILAANPLTYDSVSGQLSLNSVKSDAWDLAYLHISDTSNPHDVTANQVLPDQAGNNGKVLGTSGSGVAWITNSSNVAWGAITGTLTDQADLVSVLGTKQNVLSEGTDYLNKTHLDLAYLGLTATAADASKLNGQTAGYYQTALGFTPANSATTINTHALSSNITLNTSDLADTTNKRYVSDAQILVINAQSGTNTGDETTSTIKTKLGITTLSGSNTGDQDLSGLVPKTYTVNGHALSSNVSVTTTDLGLNNVDNTSDLNKPVSTAASTALGLKVDKTTTVNSKALSSNITLDTSDVADTTNKRYVSDAQILVINAQSGTNTGDETTSTIKTKLGITTLSGSNTGDQDLSGLVANTITVNGHALSSNVSVTTTDLGLNNVDNTSDANKPVSTATATALGLKVNTSTTVNTKALTGNIVLDTSDIAATTDKRYVSDAHLVILGNTSGANSGDETTSTIKTKLGITTLSGSNTGDQTLNGLLPTQTGNNGKVLATDGSNTSWVTNSSGVAWGAITGTLSSQSDLATALSGKQNTLSEGTDYLNKTHLDLAYLGLAATAADSAKLNGQSASYYQTALGFTPASAAITVNGYPLSGNVTLSTADVADSLDKRYVTDSQRTVIGNTSGANTGDETESTIKTKLSITTLSGSNTGDQTLNSLLPTQTGNNGKVLSTDGSNTSWITNSSGVAWGAITGTLSSQADLATALGGKVATSVTINSKALSSNITLDTSDIADTTNKRYVSDANLLVIGNTSNTNTGDETDSTIKTKLGITTLSGSNTGDQDLSGLVANTITVNGHALSSNVSVTTTDLGLNNVDNTSDVNKPVSTATATALGGKQDSSSSLSSLSGLTYVSPSFVKMTGANTFALDTNTYLTSLSGAVLTSQSTPQTIGDTTNRLAKLWTTDLTATNTITGSVSGNAGSVTNATLTTALTVNTGTVTIVGNVANSSVLTIGAGAVSVAGSNTGDQDLSGLVPKTYTVNSQALSGNITLTTANIADSTNKRYVTDANLTTIGNQSGTNTGDNAANSSTTYIGTTAIALNRASASQALTGITSIDGNAATVSNATLTTGLTVNTGTLTLTANSANTSVLTIGAGTVSVSGSNTGDQTLVGLGGVATSRSLTINGTAYDLSADRTWTITDITGNAGTVTGLSVTSGKTLTVQNSLTLSGTDGSTLAIGTGGTLGTAAYTAATAYQSANAGLTSIAGLTYVSPSFVKMTGANTFTLDTSTYLTSLTGAVLTDQTTPQTIGDTTNRLAKLWTTDLTATNAITGSITGNAATVTTNANLTGAITSVGNATSIASQTGTGTKFVVDTSPTLVTPTLGVATATSIAIGANTLDTTEWAYLDGQNQAVKTTSTPAFAGLGIGAYSAANLLTLSQAISGTTTTTTGMRISSTITTTSAVGAGAIISPTINTSTGSVLGLEIGGTYQIPNTSVADAILIAPTVTPATSSSTTDGLYITSPVVSSGTLGTNYAIRIGNQSTATTNYGIMFAGTGVGNGINWGTDATAANLYKSATSTIKTDGTLLIAGSLGATGTRVAKGWFTDLESTNAIVGSITGNAATVTTNANLTGAITSVGNATSIASQTGTGTKFVVDTSPTLVTPIIGAATGTSLSVSGLLASTGTTIQVSSANVGASDTILASNTDNTDGLSNATLATRVGGASGGDPAVLFTVASVQDWKMGIDNSDSDAFVIAASSALGSSNALRITTAGAVSVPGALSVTGHVSVDGSAASTGYSGTGKFVFDTSPTLVTPTLGDASATTLTLTLGTAQDYLFTNRGDNLALQGQKTATQTQLEMFSKDGDNGSGVNLVFWGLGSPSSVTNSEWGSIGYNSADNSYSFLTNKAGTGTARSIKLKPGNTTALTLDPTTLLATFAGSIVTTNVTDSGLTAGRVTFAGASEDLTDSANLTFDGTKLSIGNVSPVHVLDVKTSSREVAALQTTGTSGRLNLVVPEATNNLFSLLWTTTDSASTTSAHNFAHIYGIITQSDPSPLKGSLVFQTNSGDSLATRATLDETGLTLNNLTLGRVTFAGTSGLLTDSANFTYDSTAGLALAASNGMAIGGTPSGRLGFWNTGTKTDTSTSIYGFADTKTVTGTNTATYGLYSAYNLTGTNTVSTAYGILHQLTVNAGTTATTSYGLRIQDPTGAGTVTNNYGLYIDSLAKGGTLNHALYFAGTGTGNDINWAGDTNLYRSAANTLSTDDLFTTGSGVDVYTTTTGVGLNFYSAAGGTFLGGLQRVVNEGGATAVIQLAGTTSRNLELGNSASHVNIYSTSKIQWNDAAGSSDTNLYRSAANTLKTDDALIVTGHATLEGVASTGATGSGRFVFDTSPALVTPALGAATYTTLSGGNITDSGITAGQVVLAGTAGLLQGSTSLTFDPTNGMAMSTVSNRLSVGIGVSTNLGIYAKQTFTNTAANIQGILSDSTVSNDNTAYYGLVERVSIADTKTLDANYGVYVFNPIGLGTVAANYGLYIPSQAKGTTNYPIYLAGTSATGADNAIWWSTDVKLYRSASSTLKTDGAFIVGGHVTLEGVTSTGATGAGKFVFDTAPTIQTSLAVSGTGNGALNVGNQTSPQGIAHFASNSSATVVIERASGDANSGALQFRKAQGTVASPTAVASGNNLGALSFYGYYNSAYQYAASIFANVDAAPSGSIVPGNLIFNTANASGAMTQALKIDSAQLATFAGGVTVTGTTTLATSLNGMLKAANGIVSQATAGTDYGTMANPMTTAGDLIYGGASGAPTRLAAGGNGNVLQYSTGYDFYTKSVLHFEGSNAGTTFTDDLTHTWTANGSATTSTTQKEFGSTSGSFPGGATDSIQTTTTLSDYDVGTSDFTIDFWAYLNEAMGSQRVLLGRGGGGANWNDASGGHEYIMYIGSDSKLNFSTHVAGNTNASIVSTSTIAVASAWHHFAAVRSGGSVSLYVDGTKVAGPTSAATTPATTGGTQRMVVGTDAANDTPWKGWIDEFRFSNGIARWTSNFTPPASAYAAAAASLSWVAGQTLNCGTNIGIKSVTISGGIVTGATCTTNTLTDMAENYGTADATIAAGDVVAVSSLTDAEAIETADGEATKAYVEKGSTVNAGGVIGVVSANPNITLGQNIFSPSENPRPVALSGRVRVKTSNANGVIKKGDLLTVSSVAGVATKATDDSIVTIGTALQDFDAPSGQAIMFVNISHRLATSVFAQLTVSGGLQTGTLTVTGDAIFKGVIKGNDKFAGSLTLPAGQTSIRVSKTWDIAPLSVVVTPSYSAKSWVTAADQTGFTVNVDPVSDTSQQISWFVIFPQN